MKRLRIILTVTGLLLAMGGLAHAESSMNVTLTPNPVAEGAATTITLNTSDDIYRVRICRYGTYHTAYPIEGACTFDFSWYYHGIFEVLFGAITADNEVVVEDSIFVAVYSPDSGFGFVTGGGWIDSPEGAYKSDPSLTGKANFGFVSKYKKGAEVPTGNTEFVFKAGDLNFHSSSYQWLVVNQAGTNAQFKGEGTINGEGDYEFMLWAKDDDFDTFRIKIWRKEDEDNIVYDNQEEQVIDGGNIIVRSDPPICPYCGNYPCRPPCDGTSGGSGI